MGQKFGCLLIMFSHNLVFRRDKNILVFIYDLVCTSNTVACLQSGTGTFILVKLYRDNIRQEFRIVSGFDSEFLPDLI